MREKTGRNVDDNRERDNFGDGSDGDQRAFGAACVGAKANSGDS
jgi:hypothetical protein